MYLYLTVAVIAVGVISLIGTVIVGKKVNKEAEEYKNAEDKTEAELKRSQDYEKSSLSKNLRVLTTIYVVTFILSIIAVGFYIMNK
ncbi:hypothetical protein [Alkalihalobacillus sp. AL-G]|uniref:hypothetical protein n=1 Tax=Alkalihalobacillus sp. AL-G TaxID=2926399 RepID=UPI00272B757F|nr:hypothetical protein [Alkalihalobacillus sp. AL-G]WLD94730.1 hypothetical protein MOJ78_07565 [Alkalihalobacillus sp. AL-G]